MEYAVRLEDITKTFGQHTAVSELSLDVPQGSIYGFIGPNGSGKTTTLRMIMGMIYPDSGTITVLDRPAGQAASDRIGYLPEERGLYKKMKLRDLLRFFARLKNGRDVERSIDEWLARLDLTDWADKKVEALSKGMSQKAQFIAAVSAHPELLILDEPFSGLDPVNVEVLKDAILELRHAGTTVIFSTHDMGTAERLCDTIFMIFEGQKVLDGTLDVIQARYGTDTLRVRGVGDPASLKELPNVAKVTDHGQLQELRLDPDGDANRVMRALLERTTVQSFDQARPSLHDIFIRIAGQDAQEAMKSEASDIASNLAQPKRPAPVQKEDPHA